MNRTAPGRSPRAPQAPPAPVPGPLQPITGDQQGPKNSNSQGTRQPAAAHQTQYTPYNHSGGFANRLCIKVDVCRVRMLAITQLKSTTTLEKTAAVPKQNFSIDPFCSVNKQFSSELWEANPVRSPAAWDDHSTGLQLTVSVLSLYASQQLLYGLRLFQKESRGAVRSLIFNHPRYCTCHNIHRLA